MITTVTPNPSLDRTLHLPRFTPGHVNRATATMVEPSGKGVNVALALHGVGVPVRAVLPVGGPAGQEITVLLDELGLDHVDVPIAGTLRSNISLVEADGRTDVFEFGALLFEMLTGRPAFEGKTRASLLGAILKDEPPPVSHVRPLAPAALDRIISTCLAKDPDDRYQSARDLRRSWKCIGRNSARPQFVTECCHVLVGIVSGNQPDGLLRSFRRRFQKNRQLTNNGSRCF